MIELAKHIEVLLLSNDCVAVPNFGGFVAHYVPARVDQADAMFLPPMRTIGYNPQLKMNDSLLVQSYVEAHDISYPEALRRIEAEVDEIEKKISHEGSCLLDGIGTLATSDEGHYSFEPYEAGILTPTLYGLSSFDFCVLNSKLIESNLETEETPKDLETDENTEPQSLIELLDDETENEEHAINIKMSWVRNTVAVAAAIVLFFLLTTPVANSNLESPSMSALQNAIIGKLIPKDSNMAPATPVVASNEVVAKDEVKPDSVKKVPVVQKKPTEIGEKSLDNPYCIVLASQVKQSNAEIFVQKLRNRGFKDTDIYINKGVVRVVYGHFQTESAAYVELHKLRFEEDFEEGWVYKRKVEG